MLSIATIGLGHKGTTTIPSSYHRVTLKMSSFHLVLVTLLSLTMLLATTTAAPGEFNANEKSANDDVEIALRQYLQAQDQVSSLHVICY